VVNVVRDNGWTAETIQSVLKREGLHYNSLDL
jgi:hypothetical protein